MNIGWIGTGVMGVSMCKHILKAGHKLRIYNRTFAKAQPLVEAGAEFVQPRELAQHSDAVFLMLGYPKDVEQVVLGDQGILNHMKKGTVLVDHTTSSPELAERIFKEAKEKGIDSIDAPVSGGDIGAREGRLVVMCGGEQKGLDRINDILKVYSGNVQLMGGAGLGQHTKMVNQIVLAGNMIGTVEGLLYGHKCGLNLEQLINTIKSGAANSTAWSVLGLRMVKGDFEPGFYVEHFIKDLSIGINEANRMNLSLPGLALVKQLYHALVAQGGGRNGTQALLLALERLNNHKIR
ncbi:unnamed protein product [Paramecium pentaurelia]|uniref:3-hydroxyisobutyrate dehydrogenase n=1 Tax=Paramecium pentaurelia TaxID=43138 RepID=A0A8S1XBG7_9CILI|nr:unnamed protein product [Paramecium pentaurelia]